MQEEIILKTKNREEMIDITRKIENIIKKSKIKEGVCFLFIPHTTAAVLINENADPNISLDILKALRNLIPPKDWKHNLIDNNADSHIKSSIIGISEIVPIREGQLCLGKWQCIFFCEFDGPRERKIIIKII